MRSGWHGLVTGRWIAIAFMASGAVSAQPGHSQVRAVNQPPQEQSAGQRTPQSDDPSPNPASPAKPSDTDSYFDDLQNQVDLMRTMLEADNRTTSTKSADELLEELLLDFEIQDEAEEPAHADLRQSCLEAVTADAELKARRKGLEDSTSLPPQQPQEERANLDKMIWASGITLTACKTKGMLP